MVDDGIVDCPAGEDEHKSVQIPLFSMLCDWYQDMSPVFENGREETDETDCGSYFPCNNQYTQCDGVWNCRDGLDEANCPSSLCPPFYHLCVSLVNDSIECLPITFANDGIIHCRGGSDEQHHCRNLFPQSNNMRYRCSNETHKCIFVSTLCANDKYISRKDDERCDEDENVICPLPYFQNDWAFPGLCSSTSDEQLITTDKLLCSLADQYSQNTFGGRPNRYLTLRHAGYYPSPTTHNAPKSTENTNDKIILTHMHRKKVNIVDRIWLCNRGIHIFINKKKENGCFCPPAYYGDRCQYQNQRVSLILKFMKELSLDRNSIFHIVIMLIDEKQTIESYDKIIYVPARDCNIKFRLNLLYSSRPKDSNKTYSVHIDAYNNTNLVYHLSWYLLIRFQDLPINHVVTRLFVGTEENAQDSEHCSIDCGKHGQCVKYANTSNYFCQCLPGWFGYSCNISHDCRCATDSRCVGVFANQSICICPLNKFGTFCQLRRSVCSANACNSRGTCVPDDPRMEDPDFMCLCNEGYFGLRCQFVSTKIEISFDSVSIPQAIFTHYITVMKNAPHVHTTVFKKIPYDQDTVTLFHSGSYHILFTEFSNHFYLTVIQEKSNASKTISTRILRSHRCEHISTLFNHTILDYGPLRRMKYYHIPCQKLSQLVCFYDEVFMCLCNLHRQANCFEFHRNISYKCSDSDYCQNNAQCLQDDPLCPLTFVCVCSDCYFGSQCQFTTKTFDLSLETILGYQIHSHVSFARQPLSLKICLIVTIIILIIGLITVSLSIITFKSKKLRETGCGNYLFVSSIICLLHIIIFGFRFSLLILSQMKLIDNYYFLLLTCKSMDFLLKILPNTRDCTNIHDPIYRRLIDDTGEKRTCPLFINIISALVFIILTARQRSTARKNQTYKQHLLGEFRQHKHLLISPFILTLFTLPRLIISVGVGHSTQFTEIDSK
ncbi:hypothetical protein I4U23_027095 [Adineta vaga]|nr:hypothetical protein I4U23_027095 [Adineta vaga]